MILMIDNSRKSIFNVVTDRFNFLVQYYSTDVNMQNLIREKRNSMVIVVVDRRMLDKVENIQRTYPNVVFLLENFNNDQIADRHLELLDGQLGEEGDFERLLAEITKES